MTLRFQGFPKAGLVFLRNLGLNNNKEWFEANKEIYQTQLLNPGIDFIETIGAGLTELIPEIRYDTRTNGSGSLMRIYRDTRFSKDKTPYKTALAGMWWQGEGKKTEHPGFGFHLEATHIELMTGIFGFSKEQLHKFRAAVASPKGEELAKIIKQAQAVGYHLSEPKYKKVPKEYPQDHPRAELLKHAGLYMYPDGLTADIVTTPILGKLVFSHFQKLIPLHQWLVEVLN